MVVLLVLVWSCSVVEGMTLNSSIDSKELQRNKKHPIVSEYEYSEEGIYDADFWDGFDQAENYYEHDFVHIPDFINKTEVGKWFNMTHHLMWGFEKGIYNNTVILNP